jgi:exodeoxyribonuclease III
VPLRVVSYNIRFGGGQRVPLLAKFLTALEPDVVVLQEASDRFAFERLAMMTGLSHTVHRQGHSVAVMARSPLRRHEWHHPPRTRAFLEFEVTRSDLRFIGLHLPSGLWRRGERARLRHVDALLATIGPEADDRTLLIGDLNSVAHGDEPLVADMPLWLRLLLRLYGPIRTDVIDRLMAAGWVDAYRVLHSEEAGFTLPAGLPHVRLDYLLAPRAVIPVIRHCAPALDATLAARASDHLPLVSVFDD